MSEEQNQSARKPSWLKVKLPKGRVFKEVQHLIKDNGLVTVCEEAMCPNRGECWSHGTATFMACGDVCTRACGFCATRTAKPKPLDPEEPRKIAESVAHMKLNHAVVTMVTRDDLADGGAAHIAEIICRIDHKLRQEGRGLWVINNDIVHMANLSIYVGSYINGVAEIHSQILKDDCFKDWYAQFPERFQNKTNGITPRRWLGLCNPELVSLLRTKVSKDFLLELDALSELKGQIDNELIDNFYAVKRIKKEQLAAIVAKKEGIQLNPDFMFDIQVKRLHEYKRQLMNALSVVDIYFRLKNGELPEFQPTVYMFGAKSAPGYARAKAIIRYINRIAKMINNDPYVNDKMKVVFVQNYNCSYAEHIIPAADVSEQISPAGLEASGTGNMKFMLNGAVTLGTLDGANVEIAQEAGAENEYIFGATVDKINEIKGSYNPRAIYDNNPHLKRAIDTLVDGTVPTDADQRDLYHALLDSNNWSRADNYYTLLDYPSYIEAKLRANADYKDRYAFGRKCLMNIACAGKFSSDRTIRQYAEEIWHIEPTQY